MKRIFLSLLACVLGVALFGCAGTRPYAESNGSIAYDGVSAQYPDDVRALAETAALELARRYPPGRTNLSLVQTPGAFAQSLDTALRSHGFVLLRPESPGMRLGYILDLVRGEARPTAYLKIKTSDGGQFGFVRVLAAPRKEPHPKPVTPAPARSEESLSSFRENRLQPDKKMVVATDSGRATPAPVQEALDEMESLASVKQGESVSSSDSITASPMEPEGWSIAPGSLESQLAAWADRAGYQLAWKAARDFEMESHARFRGSFLGAVRQLFTGLHKSGHPLRVTIYQANKVLEVVED